VSATVEARRIDDGDPLVFEVAIRETGSETRHRVTLARTDLARLGGGVAAEALIEASFRFLLDREPKEAILSRFDISVISKYFGDFERALPGYLAQG
jgi:hypothetical protein